MTSAADQPPWEEPDQYLRFLTGSIPVLLAYIDVEHRYRFVNEAYASWFGHPAAQIVGMHVREIIGAEAYENVCPFMEAALAGMPLTFEREMPYAEVEPRYVHITFVPDRRTGTVRGISAVVTDITERRRVEEERWRVQEELALVVSGARCLLWHADVSAQGDALLWESRFADEEALRGFGIAVPPGQDVATAWYVSRVEEDRRRDDVNAARHVRAGEDYIQEFRCRRADGSMIWMREDVRVVAAAPGRWRLVGVSTEITERKQAEAEREWLLREAQAATVRQRIFLRDVLASVTDNRLRLCDGSQDLPQSLPTVAEPIPLSEGGGLWETRRRIEAAAVARSFDPERTYDLMTAVSEAGMNAIVHADGGVAQVCANDGGRIQVWIRDRGAGIPVEQLPRATLARGYSTSATLGHGMKMMFQMVDRVFLLTGPMGTTVVLEQERLPPPPDWMV